MTGKSGPFGADRSGRPRWPYTFKKLTHELFRDKNTIVKFRYYEICFFWLLIIAVSHQCSAFLSILSEQSPVYFLFFALLQRRNRGSGWPCSLIGLSCKRPGMWKKRHSIDWLISFFYVEALPFSHNREAGFDFHKGTYGITDFFPAVRRSRW